MSAVMDSVPMAAATPEVQLKELLERQKTAFLADLPVSAETRIDRIDRSIALLVDQQDALCDAMHADFGNRSAMFSKFVDLSSSVGALKQARSHVRRWMKRDRRPVRFPLNLLGARAWVEYQPLGVVGIVSPWNFPVNLTFSPLAGALAAGNRVMIKPSEHTPETSALMRRLIAERYDESEVAVVTGGPEVGQAFTALPFDHLFFTGATSIGRHVMRAAAQNLTPVTLELGGKSPAILGDGADFEVAADRIIVGKMMNAGQICLAPDDALVSRARRDEFVQALKKASGRLYPTTGGNDDYTSVASDRHAERIKGYLDEARAAGVEVHLMQPEPRTPGDRRFPLAVVIDPPDELAVMREEIFGPILPIRSYESIDDAVSYINAHDRPLGLYYFGPSESEARKVLNRTISGGVTLNDVIFHISVDDLPFGGVGPSGMGSYHGFDGFKTFSHAKAVYRQAGFDIPALIGLKPPYGNRLKMMLKMDLRK